MRRSEIETEIRETVSELIPLTLLAGELGESVDAIAHRLRDDLVRDDLGFRCVSAATAQRAITHRDEQAAQIRQRQAETTARLKELEARRPKIRGVPAPAGSLGSAVGVVMAAENDDRDWLYGSGKFTR